MGLPAITNEVCYTHSHNNDTHGTFMLIMLCWHRCVQEHMHSILEEDIGFSFISHHGIDHSLLHQFLQSQDKHTTLMQILLDLCMYDSSEIRRCSLQIITKMHYFDKDLFDKAEQVSKCCKVM